MALLKKLVLLTLALLPLLVIGACTPETETSHFQSFDSAGYDSRISYDYQGDKVLKQTTEDTMSYSFLSASNADEAKKAFESLVDMDSFKDLTGVSHKVDYLDDRLVQRLEIDYTKADIKEVAHIIGLSKAVAEKADFISYKASKKAIEASNYSLVEDDNFRELP